MLENTYQARHRRNTEDDSSLDARNATLSAAGPTADRRSTPATVGSTSVASDSTKEADANLVLPSHTCRNRKTYLRGREVVVSS